MGRYVLNPDRKQLYYDMIDVDRLVPEEHDVRRLWAFLDHLEMETIYRGYRAIEEEFGRMPIEPKVLFAVWLYGFMKGISSSEVLAELCEVHNEFRWICGRLRPCARTLRNFRNSNRPAFEGLLTDSIAALMRSGLVSVDTVSQDGTTIRAACSKKSFKSADEVEKTHAEAAKRVWALTGMSDEEAKEHGRRKLAAMKNEAEKRMDLARDALAKLNDRRKEAKVSVTEPDSKFMKCKEGMTAPAYNVQIISSRDNSPAVLGVGVFEKSSDTYTLEEMVKQVRERLCGIGEMQNYLTDKGYYSGSNARAMSGIGLKWFCSIPDNQKGGFNGEPGTGYEKMWFQYEAGRDVYICPEGKELRPESSGRKRNAMVAKYRCADCAGCAAREKCTDSKRGRTIQRSEYEEDLKDLVKRSLSEEGKNLLKMRGRMSEKTNADIKERFKLRRFTVKGKEAVSGVIMMMSIAINALLWMKAQSP